MDEPDVGRPLAMNQEGLTWFWVSERGTLSYVNFPEPRNRAECYDLCPTAPVDRAGLIQLVQEVERARAAIVHAYLISVGDQDIDPVEVDDRTWQAWLSQGPANVRLASTEVEHWLQDPDLDGDDLEAADMNGSTARSAARVFWESNNEDYLDILGVEVIEGDHPGSSYYAAELCKPVEEANQIAIREGIPVRFKLLKEKK